MLTFPGWREVGRAMRWARQDTFVRRSILAHGGHCVEVTWEDLLSAVVVSPLDDGIEVRVITAEATVRLRRPTALRALRVLAALDLIPAELAEVTP